MIFLITILSLLPVQPYSLDRLYKEGSTPYFLETRFTYLNKGIFIFISSWLAVPRTTEKTRGFHLYFIIYTFLCVFDSVPIIANYKALNFDIIT